MPETLGESPGQWNPPRSAARTPAQPNPSARARDMSRRLSSLSLLMAGAFALSGCNGAGSNDSAAAAATPTRTSTVPTTNLTSGGTTTGTTPSGSATSTAATTSSPDTVARTVQLGADGLPVDLPTAARTHTDKGAEEFAHYYMNAINTAWTGPVMGIFPSLGTTGCLSCKHLEKTTLDLVKHKQRYGSSPVRVEYVKATRALYDGTQLVSARLETLPAPILTDGLQTASQEQKKITYLLLLNWTSNRWRVEEMGDTD